MCKNTNSGLEMLTNMYSDFMNDAVHIIVVTQTRERQAVVLTAKLISHKKNKMCTYIPPADGNLVK